MRRHVQINSERWSKFDKTEIKSGFSVTVSFWAILSQNFSWERKKHQIDVTLKQISQHKNRNQIACNLYIFPTRGEINQKFYCLTDFSTKKWQIVFDIVDSIFVCDKFATFPVALLSSFQTFLQLTFRNFWLKQRLYIELSVKFSRDFN